MILTARTAQVNPALETPHRRTSAMSLGTAEHVLVAGLMVDDLARMIAPKLREHHFEDRLLGDAAAFAVWMFGVADVKLIGGLLRRRHHRPERVALELRVIRRLMDVITEADVHDALAEIEARCRGARC